MRNVAAIKIEHLKITGWNSDRKWDSTARSTRNKMPHVVRLTVKVWRDDLQEGFEDEGVEESSEDDYTQYSTLVFLPYSLDFNPIKKLNKNYSSWKFPE